MTYHRDTGGGLAARWLQRMLDRDPYSSVLPYCSYDPDTGVYCNQDDTIGFLWECLPLSFAGAKTVATLEGLFRAGLPEGSVLQMIMYADPYVAPVLNHYACARVRHDPMVSGFAEGQVAFLQRATQASERLANIPVRNFRLFVAVKMPISTRETAKSWVMA